MPILYREASGNQIDRHSSIVKAHARKLSNVLLSVIDVHYEYHNMILV